MNSQLGRDVVRCSLCQFFEVIGSNKESGICVRYPPSLHFDKTLMPKAHSLFPEVFFSQWCGEFRLDIIKTEYSTKQEEIQ